MNPEELQVHLDLLVPCATERAQPERLAGGLDDNLDDGGEDGGLLELDRPKNLDVVGEELVNVAHKLVPKGIDLGVASSSLTAAPRSPAGFC